jgi:hypothetical protein
MAICANASTVTACLRISLAGQSLLTYGPRDAEHETGQILADPYLEVVHAHQVDDAYGIFGVSCNGLRLLPLKFSGSDAV